MKIYKVVKIIDDSRIVINAGRVDKINKSSEFEIYLEGSEVIDPETKDSLGTLDTIKAIIKPIVIYEKMCICVNIENVPSELVASFTGVKLGMNTKPKRLNVDACEITGGLLDDALIKIGDKVRLVQTYINSSK